MPTLEKWSLGISPNANAYTAPEALRSHLYGTVWDDSRFDNGTFIVTSAVKEFNWERREAKTENTTYKLGKPSEDFVKWTQNQGKNLGDYNFSCEP